MLGNHLSCFHKPVGTVGGLAMLGCHFPPGKVPALSPGDFDYERCWHGFFHGMVNGGPMMDPSLGNVQTLVV